jgi:lia operon protein LiaG
MDNQEFIERNQSEEADTSYQSKDTGPDIQDPLPGHQILSTENQQIPTFQIPPPNGQQIPTYHIPPTNASASPLNTNIALSNQPSGRQISPITRVVGGCLAIILVGALTCGLTTSVLGAMAYFNWSQPELTSTGQQNLEVSGKQKITIHHEAGTIDVKPGTDNAIKVEYVKHSRSVRGNAALDNIQVNVRQSGSTVNIDTNYNEGWGLFNLGNRWVDLTITIPSISDLDVKSSAGNVGIEGITGEMNCKLSAGQLRFGDMVFTGQSKLYTSAGSLTIRGSLADKAQLDVQTSAGSVTFDGALTTNNLVNFDTSAGNVSVILPFSTDARVDGHVSAGNIIVSGFNLSVNSRSSNEDVSGYIGSVSNTSNNLISFRTSAGNVHISAS